MKELHLGETIAQKRREKGITQEALASYLGVSKPAVSKWESGQSYPDITLLPVIASYFDMTVDALMSYRPQLSQEEISDLYHRLAEDFSEKSFNEVLSACRQYIKRYASCWKLQYNMALLLLNHASLAPEPLNLIKEAEGIFLRIEKESGDAALMQQCLPMEAACAISLGEPEKAIRLLDSLPPPPMPLETLVAQAYQMQGEAQKAVALLQGGIYKNILGLINAGAHLIGLYAQNAVKMEECYQLLLETAKIFDLASMHPAALLSTHLAAAQGYMGQGNPEKALYALEHYVQIACKEDLFPMKLKGSSFLDQLHPLFESMDLKENAPRGDQSIRQGFRDAVLKNPAFKPLEKEFRFTCILQKLAQSL